MKTLAIDTSSNILSITSSGPNGIVSIESFDKMQHIKKLPEQLEIVLNASGNSINEIETIVIPKGPGAFTGLRLSWSIVKALKASIECKIISVPTLAAYNLPFVNNPYTISVLDAKRDRFYFQIFKAGISTDIVKDLDVDSISVLIKQKNTIVTGPSANLFNEKIKNILPKTNFFVVDFSTISTSRLILDYAKLNLEGTKIESDDSSGPLYVRKSDAETNLNKKT